MEASEVIAFSQVVAHDGSWCQETYKTSLRYAGQRARALRKLGYKVTCISLGFQVSAQCNLTLVDIRGRDTSNLPFVPVVRS